MYDVDLHAHTRFFHAMRGRPTAFDPLGAALLARAASRRNLDGVALTNHDYYEPFDAGPGGLQFLPGIEVSTTMGHVLVVGPDPPRGTIPYEMDPAAVVELAHDADCAAIMAHPFRDGLLPESEAAFDAVELNGKHPGTHDRVRRLAAERDLPIVAGSDAHFPIEVGRGYTRIEADELTPRAVADAIRDGRVEPRIEERPSQRVLQAAYSLVHRLKRAGAGTTYGGPTTPVRR